MADQKDSSKRIDLGPNITKAWDDMVLSYNGIVTLLEKVPVDERPLAKIKTKTGAQFDFQSFARRMNATMYKLGWAGFSLKYLQDTYAERLKTLKHPFEVIADKRPIPQELLFHMDVFFSFVSSALDIASWIVHIAAGTSLPEKKVKFDKVVEHLASSKRGAPDPLFIRLKTENDSGWIAEFDAYRDYVTHYAYILPKSELRWTAETGTIEVTIFMLPDSPKITPPKYNKKRELVPYCEDVYIKAIGTVREMFNFVSIILL